MVQGGSHCKASAQGAGGAVRCIASMLRQHQSQGSEILLESCFNILIFSISSFYDKHEQGTPALRAGVNSIHSWNTPSSAPCRRPFPKGVWH